MCLCYIIAIIMDKAPIYYCTVPDQDETFNSIRLAIDMLVRWSSLIIRAVDAGLVCKLIDTVFSFLPILSSIRLIESYLDGRLHSNEKNSVQMAAFESNIWTVMAAVFIYSGDIVCPVYAIGHIDARVVGGPKLQNDWLALLELTQTEQALILQASIPDQMSLDTFRAYQAENARVRMVNNRVAHAVIIIIFNVSQFVINWIHIFPLQIGDSY
ncbi:hypothetical protein DERF_001629 [Dermatophagoides farinae]|uniref:Uncharacterized protein n=1 Tax=Dermatophagoides farinae TaxID=6954 RepID=A0A922LBC5_DERFA|nr:hypothetical protein DERF_001629 [Dermatophagoides farinae]